MQPFQRIAAIFDIDDSLLDGNAGTIFTWFLYSNREMVPSVRSQVPRALYEYARKRLTEADMVALGSRCQQGIRADRLRDLARKCFDRDVKKRVTQQGLRTVRRHLLMGHLIILASGSPQFIIDELGRFLHAHEAVGTRARIREGLFTDKHAKDWGWVRAQPKLCLACFACLAVDLKREVYFSAEKPESAIALSRSCRFTLASS